MKSIKLKCHYEDEDEMYEFYIHDMSFKTSRFYYYVGGYHDNPKYIKSIDDLCDRLGKVFRYEPSGDNFILDSFQVEL